MSSDIHYEVFVKANAKGSWRLVEARDAKKDALALADTLLKKTPDASVRVSKEKWDDATNTFRSYTVFETGEKFAEDRRADREGELPCLSPADLCNTHARETIGRALKDWLRRQLATPLELLHRVDLVEKLEASGTEFQHAVQKVAIASASSQKANVQSFVKQINELVQRAVAALYAAHRAEAFPELKKGGLAAAVEALAVGPNKDFRLRGAIAGRLKDAADWRAKLSLAVELAEEAGEIEGAPGGWALDLVGEFIVDLLEDEAARAGLLEGATDLGDELDAFTDMLRAPDRARLTDAGKRLGRAFGEGHFIDAQRAIARYVLAKLGSPGWLKPGRIREEIDLNRSIADRLILTVGRLLSQEELVETFVYRSGRLLDGDAIVSLLEGARDPGDELFRLIELEDNIVGDANKAKLAGQIRARLSGFPADNHFLKGENTPTRRLAELAALRAAVDAAAFAKDDALDIGDRLDRFAIELELRLKLFDQVSARARAVGGPLHAAAALLQLAEKGLIPRGRLAGQARARAAALLASPDGQAAATSGDPCQTELARELVATLSGGSVEGERAA
jgi:hypothetical protein